MVSSIPGLDRNNKEHMSVLRVIETYDRAQLFYFILALQKKL